MDEGIDMSDPAIVEKLGRKGQLELEIETYERILVKYGKELFHPEAVVSSWWRAGPPFKLLLLFHTAHLRLSLSLVLLLSTLGYL